MTNRASLINVLLSPVLLIAAVLALVAGAALWAIDGQASSAVAPWGEVPPAIAGKPNASVGHLKAAVTERLAPDRAVIEATWARRSALVACRIELMVPTGATLLEGERVIELGGPSTLDPKASGPNASLAGQARWVLDFPSDQDLDAVVLLCGTLDGHGAGTEWTVPLARAPSRD